MTRNYEAFTQHARWIIEKSWDANNELMRRASALLGFTGVEIGILGAMNPEQFERIPGGVFVFAGVLLLLIFGLVSLVMSLRDKHFEYPSLSRLIWEANSERKDGDLVLFEYVLNLPDPANSLESNLVAENKEITKWFSRGLLFVTGAQILLGLLLILKWTAQI